MLIRHVRLVFRTLLGVTFAMVPLEAQQFRVTPREIGQIADAAMQGVIPPDKSLTRFTVAERGIRFDFERTMTAFGSRDSVRMASSLGLRSSVKAGSRALLTDCDQFGTKPCSLLGREAYVFLEPISISDTEAVVSLTVAWAQTASERTFLTSFTTQVHLSRSGSGEWKFVRAGLTVVG
jgi:hypothetical protein